MRLTRYTHACVRLDDGDRSLVIDPGVWSEPQALSDVDAVLVTHEHSDHVDELRLAGLDVPIYAPPRAGQNSAGYQEIEVGTTVTVGGFEITAVGGEHARVVASQRPCPNTGYVINGSVYHPGDALHVPGLRVDTLLVPIQASWLKTSEAIDFVNKVVPRIALGMHEAQLNDRGLGAINHWLEQECGPTYRWLAPRSTVEVGSS